MYLGMYVCEHFEIYNKQCSVNILLLLFLDNIFQTVRGTDSVHDSGIAHSDTDATEVLDSSLDSDILFDFPFDFNTSQFDSGMGSSRYNTESDD